MGAVTLLSKEIKDEFDKLLLKPEVQERITRIRNLLEKKYSKDQVIKYYETKTISGEHAYTQFSYKNRSFSIKRNENDLNKKVVIENLVTSELEDLKYIIEFLLEAEKEIDKEALENLSK